MKKLIPIASAFGITLMLSSYSLHAQTPWDPNEGLLVTEGSTEDAVILSWWGSMFHTYEIDFADELFSEDHMEWDALPEVIEGSGAPIAWEVNISGLSLFGMGESRRIFEIC